MKKHWIVTAILALSVIAILLDACQKSSESEDQRKFSNEGIRFNREARRQSLQAETARVDSMRAEAEEMLKSLREKEILLQNKQAELDALRRQLSQKETELVLREAAAQRAKKTGAWLFAIGVALITLSLILFVRRVKRRPKSAAPLSTSDVQADSGITIAEKAKQKPATKQEASPAEKKDALATLVKTKPTVARTGRAPRARTQPGDKARAAAKKTSRTRVTRSENSGTPPADETPATKSKRQSRKKAAKPEEDKGAPESPQE